MIAALIVGKSSRGRRDRPVHMSVALTNSILRRRPLSRYDGTGKAVERFEVFVSLPYTYRTFHTYRTGASRERFHQQSV